MAATEYQFILAKPSVIAAAAFAAAIKEEVESQEVLSIMKKLALRIGSEISEIFLYLSCLKYILDIVNIESQDINASQFHACSEMAYFSNVKNKQVRDMMVK